MLIHRADIDQIISLNNNSTTDTMDSNTSNTVLSDEYITSMIYVMGIKRRC